MLTGQPQPATIKLAFNQQMYDYNSLDLTWNLNPLFGFYGVKIFTGIKAGFEYPCIRTIIL